MRTCKACGLSKPLDTFRLHTSKGERYSRTCDECLAALMPPEHRDLFVSGFVTCVVCDETKPRAMFSQRHSRRRWLRSGRYVCRSCAHAQWRHRLPRAVLAARARESRERRLRHPCQSGHEECRSEHTLRRWAYGNLPLDYCYLGLEPLAEDDRNLEHVIPLNALPGDEQGTHCIDNVAWSCSSHNRDKGNLPLATFFGSPDPRERPRTPVT